MVNRGNRRNDYQSTKIKEPDEIEFAGDYNLAAVILQNHKGEGVESNTGGENILPQMQELNIFEGITKKAITGSIVILDATNLIANLPIQGTERIIFKLSTPGTTEAENIVDASELTGHPFYVYKITNRKQISQGVLLYTLHFGSREFMRNLRTRVSRAYSGTIDTMVANIFADKSGLDSRKTLNFEETRNQDKIVIPNMRPLDAIAMLSRRALPKNTNGVGYYFYETTKGFHFRSWESMCVTQGAFERPVKATFEYKMMNMEEPIGNFYESDQGGSGDHRTDASLQNKPKVLEDYESVEHYEFTNNFHDVAANTVMGTYGHNVITHNIYDKSYNIIPWNYHLSFDETKHTESLRDEPADNKFQVSESPVDFDENNISDYPNSRVSLQGTTQFLHNEDTGAYGTDVADDGRLEGMRISQYAQVNSGTRLKLVIKGHSYLEAGDLIQFNLNSVESTNSDRFDLDPQYSGRYVVASIRHRVTSEEYKMVLECIKDSVKIPFDSVDKFPGTTDKEDPVFTDIYQKEKPSFLS
jgi:hypothetical protein